MTLTVDRPSTSIFARLVRDADWLTGERARRIGRVWLALTILAAVIWVALSRNGVDRLGKPLGSDFASFWTASRLALAGRPDAAWNLGAHHAAQMQRFGPTAPYYAFFYPPAFLLVCLPLGLLPYLASLATWLVATGAAYAAVVRRWGGQAASWLAIAAFPAVLVNVGHGQNGFLSAALMGAGLMLMDKRPWLAGALLGCLVYKPQLGLILPIALIASGRWRTILGAAAASIGLCAISWLAFGLGAWRGFFADSAIARAVLEQGAVGDAKMQSLFAAARLLHASLAVAYAVQAVAAVAVCAALVACQRRWPRSEAEGPAIATAALLVSPFLLDYDLILLAIPLAWLLREALRTGFLPYEKAIMAAAFMAPAVSRNLATATGVLIGPLLVAGVFWLVLRRWGRAASVSQQLVGRGL